MRRGTTPTISIAIKGLQLSDIDEWYVILSQDDIVLLFENDRIRTKNGLLQIDMTEEETLAFRDGVVAVQIRAVTKSGQRIASEIKTDTIDGLLWDEVI